MGGIEDAHGPDPHVRSTTDEADHQLAADRSADRPRASYPNRESVATGSVASIPTPRPGRAQAIARFEVVRHADRLGRRAGTKLLARLLALDQVAEHRLGQEELGLAIAGTLELVVASRHVVDQVFHPQKGMPPISHGEVFLHSMPLENAIQPDPVADRRRRGRKRLSTAAGSKQNHGRLHKAKSVPGPIAGRSRILNAMHRSKLEKKSAESPRKRTGRPSVVRFTRLKQGDCMVMDRSDQESATGPGMATPPFHCA